jgi:hypothetical protein
VSFSGGLITIPDGPALSLGNRATVECWIRPLSTSANQRFIEQGDGWGCESDRAFDMALNPAYRPGVAGYLTGWAFYRPGCTAAEAPGVWSLGQWTHVAMTIDTAALKHRLYVNGVLVNESPHYNASYLNRAIGDSTRRLVLGGAGDWSGHNYTGEMDELRIWNVVRSQSEIQESMSHSLPPETPGLVAYFKFDEGGGTVTQDATGNLASGALGAGVSWIAVPGSLAVDAVQWRVQDGGNGHWYKAITVPTDIDWLHARDLALLQGGNLATPSTAAEDSWLRSQFLSDDSLWTANNGTECPQCRGPFIGGSNTGGPWSWVDGSPWCYTNWYPGNPHQGWHATLYWDKIGMWGPAQRWGSTAPDNAISRSYIIEWSADCNNDGVVDYGQILAGTLPDVNNNGVPDGCDPAPCNLADVASVGSTPPLAFHDGRLTVDDVIVFVNLYSDGSGCPGASPCSQADVCGIGGPPAPPDGQLTVDDIIAFVNAFGEGC